LERVALPSEITHTNVICSLRDFMIHDAASAGRTYSIPEENIMNGRDLGAR
jgi:hypothetical protein